MSLLWYRDFKATTFIKGKRGYPTRDGDCGKMGGWLCARLTIQSCSITSTHLHRISSESLHRVSIMGVSIVGVSPWEKDKGDGAFRDTEAAACGILP